MTCVNLLSMTLSLRDFLTDLNVTGSKVKFRENSVLVKKLLGVSKVKKIEMKCGHFAISNLCDLRVPEYTLEDVAAWSVRNVE